MAMSAALPPRAQEAKNRFANVPLPQNPVPHVFITWASQKLHTEYTKVMVTVLQMEN